MNLGSSMSVSAGSWFWAARCAVLPLICKSFPVMLQGSDNPGEVGTAGWPSAAESELEG